jgi:predicted dehydrogenase
MASKPHARALQDLGDVIDVRGVYLRSAERRAAVARDWGFPAVDGLDALADDPALDAVLILTPPNARAELVDRFSAAGKAILTEKPVERTTAAAEAIVAQCADRGVMLGVVLQHRFREGAERLAALRTEGALGRLATAQLVVPWWREQAYYDEPGRGSYARDGGGVLISQAIHSLDLMLSLTGPVAEVQAVAGKTPFHAMEAEDFVAGGLRFESGAMGSVMATTAAWPGAAEHLTLVYDTATATLDSSALTIDWRDGRQEVVGTTAGTGGGADPMAFPHHWHKALIADFAEAVLGGRPPRVTGQEALKVHRLIDALVRSSAERRAVAPAG